MERQEDCGVDANFGSRIRCGSIIVVGNEQEIGRVRKKQVKVRFGIYFLSWSVGNRESKLECKWHCDRR